MSNALLRKSLDLFNDDTIDLNEFKPSKKSKKKTSNAKQVDIGTNRSNRKKELKKLKRKQEEQRIAKKKKTAEDEYYKYEAVDNTDYNLNMMAKMAKLDTASSSIVTKILDYNKGKLSKNKEMVEPAPKQQSIFSDRDFDEFEKEYDVDFWDKK